jgi:signal transduction histidine kinase/DNA-binding NarL/FixJ family response regulator
MKENGVLIVEDDRRFRRSILNAFKASEAPYRFIEAESIREAMTKLDEHPNIKVILLDLDLPDGSGRDFLEQVKAKIQQYRIIVLTAHDEKLAADMARKYGVFNYLPKAQQSFTQSIRFTVAQAFKDVERELLRDKDQILFSIQEKINSNIKENTSNREALQALNDVLNLICKSVRSTVGVHSCHIRVYDLMKGDFHLVAFDGPDDRIKGIFSVSVRKDESFSGKVAVAKEPLLFDDLQNSQEFRCFREKRLQRIRISGNELLLKQADGYFASIQSTLICPITTGMFDDEIDAVFSMSSCELSDFFSREKREVINEFVALATTAITKAWLKKRKEESQNDYKSISKVLEDISKELGGEDVKKQIYAIAIEGIAEIIRPETISIFLFNRTTGRLDNEAEFRGSENVEPPPEGYPMAQGLTGWVYTNREALRIPDLQRRNRSKPQYHDSYQRALETEYVGHIPSGRVDHYLGVPMVIGNEVIGAIQLLNKKSSYYLDPEIDKERWLLERGFSQDCENVLGIAAGYLAVAIKNADLIEERNRKIGQLETLKDVVRHTTAEMPIDELLHEIIKEVAEDVKAEICLLFLSGDRNKVVLEQSYGIPISELRDAHYEIGEGLTGKVAQSGLSILKEVDVPRGKYDAEIERYLQAIHGKAKKIKSLMIVPIRAKNETLGVIKAINKKGGSEHYEEEDLSFFESFANYMGISIENAQRYDLTNERLAVAEKGAALSHLVRAVVHEINNTKALIPVNVQMMRERLADGNYDLKEMIDVIEDSAKQAVAFANSIQAFSASRLGIKEIQDINPIIKKAIRQLLPTLEADKRYRRIRLDEYLSGVPLECSVHETPLIQVFQNIILNAFQAMEAVEAGTLIIRSSRDSKRGRAIIEFTDTGQGIEGESIREIFDPEYTTKARGTGIGLWLAQTQLSLINATIKVQSTLSKGTTFTIEIPLAQSVYDEETK